MSLSPWDLSGNISFDFSLYRPRRPSYVYATQITRRRNESYRSATKSESTEETGFDFIEDIVKRRDGGNQRRLIRGVLDGRSEGDLRSSQLYDSNHVVVNGSSGKRRKRHNSTPIAIIEGSEDDCRVTITITEPSLDLDYDDDDEYYDEEDDDHMMDANSMDTIDTKSMATSEGQVDRNSSIFKAPSQCTIREGYTKWRYIKNLVVLSLSFILVFSAFRSIQNLQTSLNSTNSLGFITMGCVHGTMFLSCLFTPVLINKLTSKWTIVLGLLFYLFWIAANFYPHFYTLIPTSIGVGFGQSLAWGAQVTYLQKLAIDYAHLSKELSQQELAKFNGIFLACFQTTHVWGNLVSSLMLTPSGSTDEFQMRPSVYCGVYDECSQVATDDIYTDLMMPMDNISMAGENTKMFFSLKSAIFGLISRILILWRGGDCYDNAYIVVILLYKYIVFDI